MTRLPLLLAAGALALPLTLGGCGDETGPGTGGSDPGTGPDDGTALPEGRYVVSEVTDGGTPRPLVEGSTIRIRLQDGTLTVNAGCNHLFGDYRLEGDRLTLSRLGGTEMGCPKPLMAQDDWLVDVLASPLTVGEDPLTLTSGSVVFTLEWQGTNPPPVTDPDGSTSSTDGPEGVTIP